MTPEEIELEKKLQERLAQLPKVVRDAIGSADVAKRLRSLAEKYKLHLDQWDLLENEVRLTMLGFQATSTLKDNIKREVGLPDQVALDLSTDIALNIFEPIRQELERELDHPAAKAAQVSDIEAARAQALSQDHDESSNTISSSTLPPPSRPVAPATPPSPTPTVKVERAPLAPSEVVKSPSHERKSVEGDPYREQLT